MAVSRIGLLSNPVDKKSLMNQGLNYLKQYPADQLARLLVDGRYVDKNGLYKESFQAYESREPGSTVAYFKAFAFLIQHLDQKIDVEFIKQLHKICLEGVQNKNFEEVGGVCPGDFRESNVQETFGLGLNRITLDGVNELTEWMSEYWNDAAIGGVRMPTDNETRLEMVKIIWKLMVGNKKTVINPHNEVGCGYEPPNADVTKKKITENTAHYLTAINNAVTEDEKLTVMVQHIETYERLHPFRDGNGRVFVNLILNFMLMQNGFPPATFYEPNIFDALGTANVVQKVKEAMQATKDIIAGKKDVLGYELNEDDKKYSRESAQELVNVLKPTASPSLKLA